MNKSLLQDGLHQLFPNKIEVKLCLDWLQWWKQQEADEEVSESIKLS